MAAQYQRFCFKKMNVRYVQAVGTTQGDLFTIGFVGDPVRANEMYTSPSSAYYFQLNETPNSFSTIPWAPASVNITAGLDQDFLGYVDADENTDAGLRQTSQGGITGFWSATQTVLSDVGVLFAEYVIELYDPFKYENRALEKKAQPGSVKPTERGR